MEKKNFLFVSIGALIGDIAWQVKKEGHDVKYFIKSETEKKIADGFVQKVDDWRMEVDWADVIVFDDVIGQGKIAAELRAQGHAVIGGTPYTDRLEDERAFGQAELKSHGIPIIPQVDFDNFADAISYVQFNPNQYVVKSNVEEDGDKKLLFVGEDDFGRDVIAILRDYQKTTNPRIKGLQLQKRIKGVEISVGAFFNGKEFIYPICIGFEHKRLFPGEIGPQTGEMGTTIFWSQTNDLFNKTIKKFEDKLKNENYVGYFDLNCIVNGRGIYPLEFTTRFGYPFVFIQTEGLQMPVSEFLYKLAKQESFMIKTKKGFQIGVRICAPPYPFNDPERFNTYTKDTVIFFRKPEKEGLHIEDVRMENDEWVIAGSFGVILTVTGSGKTMKEAQKQAYSRVNNVIIPEMYYRKDIGDRWYEDSDLLHNWGYLK